VRLQPVQGPQPARFQPLQERPPVPAQELLPVPGLLQVQELLRQVQPVPGQPRRLRPAPVLQRLPRSRPVRPVRRRQTGRRSGLPTTAVWVNVLWFSLSSPVIAFV
jgi:hypothetical protein